MSKLEAIQEEENGHIGRLVKVREVYGIRRSFRRGSTTAATNAPNEECSKDDIERNMQLDIGRMMEADFEKQELVKEIE